ncbi:unnamed protein product [Arabidopsis lyrata]|uniref:Expressed protein n=1 Tax=Arabidopsis lyrata subsp. lyrata TaxID=81972 RepID=D7KTX4_ARALL|nr:expressed protein [Arabidopsis lyrata subsp. lyrata]CAH8258395.1 unnamed protein product [Arabidopsis lyrata]
MGEVFSDFANLNHRRIVPRSTPYCLLSLAAEQWPRDNVTLGSFFLLSSTLLWRVGDGLVSPSPFGSRHPGSSVVLCRRGSAARRMAAPIRFSGLEIRVRLSPV